MKYLIKTSRAKMPTSCWGGSKYYHVALLEVDDDVERVTMISPRARGVRRVVESIGPCYRGITDQCQYADAVRHLTQLKKDLERES